MVLLVVAPDNSTEYSTISAALAASEAGDVVAVRAGTYTELLHARHDVCIRPAQPAEEWVDGQSGCVVSGNVLLSANVTMEGMEICGRVDVRKGHAVVEGCDIHGGSDGIRVGANCRLTLKDSRVHDCTAGGDGLYMGPRSFANVENCDFYACRVNAVHVKSGHLILQRCRVRDCLFGVCFRERSTGLVESNTLEHIEKIGIYVAGQSDPVVKSNAVRECGLLCVLATEQSGGHVTSNTFDGSIHVRVGSLAKLTANTVSAHADIESPEALII